MKETNTKKLYTVKNFALKNKEQGCWPDTEPSIWAMKAGVPENGLEEAFIKVGRRVLIDGDKFFELIIKKGDKG